MTFSMTHATPAVVVLLALIIGPVLFHIYRAYRGEAIFIRRIPGIDAIDEAIGRCVELGRPMAFTSGMTGVGPLLYACLGVLRYIARKAAVFGTNLFVPCQDPEGLVLTEATLQNAYRTEKKLSQLDPNNLRFLSESQFAFAAGYMGLAHRENIAGAFLFGRYAAESLILAEAGQQVGAVQVAATVSTEQIPFFITVCDYTLIGEELYAAGAYLSEDPVQTGSLRGQDYAKLVIALTIALGIAQATYFAIRGQSVDTLPLVEWFMVSWESLFGGA